MKGYILTILLIFFLVLEVASAKELNVTIVQPGYYSDIWLGVSTGGYRLITEKGSSYELRVFVKNGMSNRSLHNVEIIPNNFPFEINSITPKYIEQLKPMEIRIYYVNVSIPETEEKGTYPIKFEVSSDEFPIGVFSLESEIKVINRLKKEFYILYVLIMVIILILLFYRKFKIKKINEKEKRKL
ncbi:hypothetical protein A3K73_02310 [Candidatus Pacearchaeota archaeon RBG_13_36_9]|nr:MAG: hypothetical protein A3K73_02310 [Candidatus Pacearchaeota archaeon RBG_13_36_9]